MSQLSRRQVLHKVRPSLADPLHGNTTKLLTVGKFSFSLAEVYKLGHADIFFK